MTYLPLRHFSHSDLFYAEQIYQQAVKHYFLFFRTTQCTMNVNTIIICGLKQKSAKESEGRNRKSRCRFRFFASLLPIGYCNSSTLHLYNTRSIKNMFSSVFMHDEIVHAVPICTKKLP